MMISTKLILNLKLGLHARPSAYIVTKMQGLQLDQASLTLRKESADPRSILSLLTLFAKPGDEIEIKLSGPDEEKALKIIEDIFNEKDNAVIYP
jgi:phosphotransferase system HPr (HPr) family protein